MIRAYLYIKRGFKLIISQDYYHQPQGVGKAFYPGEIKGYFNDLKGKTSWKGEVDSEGIPNRCSYKWAKSLFYDYYYSKSFRTL